MIARVARSQAPVHITGESGTGKELVARLIHESGARADGPFVPVNCGAIPTELMESELFGHKRGSFTGAVADKKGLVQSAEGGTLFLDEVADLPLHMQVKLLRVVQEKTVRPVGEPREVPVDVRILSATHKNLAELVAQGRFREDCSTASTSSRCACRRCASMPRTFRELAEAMLQRLARAHGAQLRRRSRAGGHARCCSATPSPATCASWRTSWSARSRCRRPVSSTCTTCSCAAVHRQRRVAGAWRRSAEQPRSPPRQRGAELAHRARRSAREHRARGHRQGAGEDALQQDRGREAARHELSGAALSDQEARHRVARSAGDSICVSM